MGVYIKGMEMPKNCPCELVGIGYDMYCSFVHGIPARVKEYDECCKKETRPDWCPLIPVPPHGRLGDLDKLADSFEPSDFWNSDAEDNCFAAVRIVHSAPTIIPAEED